MKYTGPLTALARAILNMNEVRQEYGEHSIEFKYAQAHVRMCKNVFEQGPRTLRSVELLAA
jgi:hypothetical protein